MRAHSCHLSIIIGLLLASTPGVHAAEDRWIKLAEHAVGTGLATETVKIGENGGAFERVRLEATGASLLVHELRIYFVNGQMQRFARQEQIARDSLSSAYSFEGGTHEIDHIELTFKGWQGALGRGARLAVWGERSDHDSRLGIAAADGWRVLGEKSVGAGIANTTFPVAGANSRLEAIQINVADNDVAFHDIRVIYTDGEVETLAVRRLIRAGQSSPLLEIKDAARGIRAVELIRETNPNAQGEAIIQVVGRRTTH